MATAGELRVYFAPLERGVSQTLVDAYPELERDFWYVEHQVACALQPARTNDAASAHYIYLPHYTMCEYAAWMYQRGIDVANPPGDDAARATREVNRSFRRAIAALERARLWNERTWPRYLLAFGQGRSAKQGDIIVDFPQLAAARFIGVEARPKLARAFRVHRDIVIPAHLGNAPVAAAVRAAAPRRTRLAHFRGRCWGPTRKALVRELAGVDPAIAIYTERVFQLGGEGTARVEQDVADYYAEMRSAVFALCPGGYTPWTLRFYEAIHVGCIPVLIPGSFVPPFRDKIDYARCTVTVPTYDLPRLPQILRSIPDGVIADMLDYLDSVRGLLDWNAGAPALLREALAQVA